MFGVLLKHAVRDVNLTLRDGEALFGTESFRLHDVHGPPEAEQIEPAVVFESQLDATFVQQLVFEGSGRIRPDRRKSGPLPYLVDQA